MSVSHQECNVMDFIKDHLKPIYQILSIELPDYNMQLRTTKCLNTSILTMFLLLGTKGLAKSSYCSVSNIKNRAQKNHLDKSYDASLYDKLVKDIMSLKEKHRHFYYIMITDGEMVQIENNNTYQSDKNYFPGHVFVIEKIPQFTNDIVTSNKYNLYQSYINQYTLKGHYERNNNSMDIEAHKLKDILSNGLKNIFIKDVWNENISNYWKELTYVDSKEFNGFSTENLRFCYQKKKVSCCYKLLDKFVDFALSELAINPNKYYVEDATEKQLTNEELKKTLLEMKKKIKALYKIYNVKDN